MDCSGACSDHVAQARPFDHPEFDLGALLGDGEEEVGEARGRVRRSSRP